MRRIPSILWLTLVAGAVFDSLFVVSVVEYFWGDGDEGRVVVCTAFALFTLPLYIGTILIFCRRQSGLLLLRFGSVVFICEPNSLIEIWSLPQNPKYIAYMNGVKWVPPVACAEVPPTSRWFRGRRVNSPPDGL